MTYGRRELLGLLCGAAVANGEQIATREYRARATVLLFSLPLFHRDNVGTGYLRVAERAEGGRKELQLEFGAGSLPAQAAGLNRLGVFEETVVEAGGKVESAAYSGFMTTSKEKDFNEAKTALAKGDALTFTAVSGRIEGGRLSNRLLRVGGLPAKTWANREEIKLYIFSRLAEAGSREAEETRVGSEAVSPFLYAIRGAMSAAGLSDSRRFVHNGKLHHLRTKKSVAGQGETEMEGRILDGTGAELSAFRLWFEAGRIDAGPVRFEFRPRSFLRLRFERV